MLTRCLAGRAFGRGATREFRWPARLGARRPKLDNRLAAPGYDHLFTGERLADQARKPVLGLGKAVGGHVESPSWVVSQIAEKLRRALAALIALRYQSRHPNIRR